MNFIIDSARIADIDLYKLSYLYFIRSYNQLISVRLKQILYYKFLKNFFVLNMTFFKENNNVLIILDSDISNDDIVDFISAIQKRLNHAEQLSIVSTKELKKCKYINIFKYVYINFM